MEKENCLNRDLFNHKQFVDYCDTIPFFHCIINACIIENFDAYASWLFSIIAC